VLLRPAVVADVAALAAADVAALLVVGAVVEQAQAPPQQVDKPRQPSHRHQHRKQQAGKHQQGRGQHTC
jgi:hypothetical protein